MARIEECTITYNVTQQFAEKCLVNDQSIFFDDESIWTLENINKGHQKFIEDPKEESGKFLDKLKKQIGSQDKALTRLFGEILSLYFLFPSTIRASTKSSQVNTILSWNDDKIPDGHAVVQAFNHGIGSGGPGYNYHRYKEVAFIIQMLQSFKELPKEKRAEYLRDHQKMQPWIDSIDNAAGRQFRHMFLHLLFPEHYENISSSQNKRQVIKAFEGMLPEADRNTRDKIDEKLRYIRTTLENISPGKIVDFYWEPWVQAWYVESPNPADMSPLELLRLKKQIVLFGPPGTGKTHTAKQIAETLIHSHILKKKGVRFYFEKDGQDFLANTLETNIHRLQLHPAYSYEDFIRALHIGKDGNTEYQLSYLPRLINRINEEPTDDRCPHVLILDEMNRTDLSRMLGECFSLLENRDEEVNLPGYQQDQVDMKLSLPGDLYIIGTMNLIDQSVEQIDFALRRRFLWIEHRFDEAAMLTACESRWESRCEKTDKKLPAWNTVADDFAQLAQQAGMLNAQIRDNLHLGEQYEIGHTYFLDAVDFLILSLPEQTRKNTHLLWNEKDKALNPVELLWHMSIKPLLDQYLSGLDRQEQRSIYEVLKGSFFELPN